MWEMGHFGSKYESNHSARISTIAHVYLVFYTKSYFIDYFKNHKINFVKNVI